MTANDPGRWIERAIVGAALAAASAWILSLDGELDGTREEVTDLKVSLATANGQFALLNERIESTNRTLLRIEARMKETP